MEEQPRFFFTVAQRPDIVNTAFLDGNPVSRSFTYHSVNNSVITRQLNGVVSNPINNPTNFTCSASVDQLVILSGNGLPEVSL